MNFLNSLELQNHSAKSFHRLKTISGRPGKQVVEELADTISALITAAHQLALEVCKTKPMPHNDGQHFRPRGVGKKRQKLANKLNTISQIKSHLACSAISSASNLEDLLKLNELNMPLCQAVMRFKKFRETRVADELPCS